MAEDSRKLVESAIAGDPAAIDQLLEKNLPGLRAFIRLRMCPELRAKESSLDLVQTACREILANAGRYRYQGESNFRHWLFTTALRKLQNRVAYYRAAKRDGRREASPPQDAEGNFVPVSQIYGSLSTPSENVQAKERCEFFERAFDQISDDHREVILLARVVGLSHREISSIMNRSESATRKLLYRALAELARKMRCDN
jgi:RNA polymerase sigma-70 factor (ECF subfamily)